MVGGRLLFDAPPTLLPHLKRLGCSLAGVSTVFLSHFHGDHFAGLPFLFLEFAHLTQRQDNLYIVGPPGVESFMEDLTEKFYPGLSTTEAGYQRVYIEAVSDLEMQVGDASVTAVEMEHGGEQLCCFGYRVTIAERTVAYTGDTMYCDNILKLAHGSEVLVIDCSYGMGKGPEHLGIEEVREIRQRIAPKTKIILTHLGSEPELAGLDNVILSQDFTSYRFP